MLSPRRYLVEATDALQFNMNFLQKSHLLRDCLELAGDLNTLALVTRRRRLARFVFDVFTVFNAFERSIPAGYEVGGGQTNQFSGLFRLLHSFCEKDGVITAILSYRLGWVKCL
jgi:hypothetical protein